MKIYYYLYVDEIKTDEGVIVGENKEAVKKKFPNPTRKNLEIHQIGVVTKECKDGSFQWSMPGEIIRKVTYLREEWGFPE